MRMTFAIAAALVAGVGLRAVPAGAQSLLEEGPRSPVVTLGILVATAKQSGAQNWVTGFGGELGFGVPIRLSRSVPPLVVGAWGQYQGVDGFSGSRLGGGLRTSFFLFAFDAGLARQSGDFFHERTTYLVLAPALQFGPGAVGLRWSLPVSSGKTLPMDFGITITIRLPIFGGGGGPERPPTDLVLDD